MLTDQEVKVVELTAETWNQFLKLPIEHPDDQNDFRYHIHALQNILLGRSGARLMKEMKNNFIGFN